MRIFVWELVQNTPIVFGCGLGLRAQARGGKAAGLLLGAAGAVASALSISLTEKRKLGLQSRPFSAKEFALNAMLFIAPAWIYLGYAPRGSYAHDMAVGGVLGGAVGIGQWQGIDQTFADGLRHTLALALTGPIILGLLRYSSSAPLMKALLILLVAALVMTAVIAIIDYYTNPGALAAV